MEINEINKKAEKNDVRRKSLKKDGENISR